MLDVSNRVEAGAPWDPVFPTVIRSHVSRDLDTGKQAESGDKKAFHEVIGMSHTKITAIGKRKAGGISHQRLRGAPE